MAERKYKNIPYNQTTSVHITWTEGKDKIALRGYAISSDSGIEKSYAKKHKIIAKNTAELPARQQRLYQLVCMDIEKHERPTVAQKSSNNSNVKSLYEIALDEVEKSGFVSADWKSLDYTQNRLTYFRRNILPILLKFDVSDWSLDDTNAILAEIVEAIMKKKQSSQHEETAKRTAQKNLHAADLIYRAMRTYYPELPEINLRPLYAGRSVLNEQIKALPHSVRKNFINLIEALIPEDPRLAFAAIFMVACGLRTAEAAGVWIDCFDNIGDNLVSVNVKYQIKKGKRINILKSKNSYRLIPINTWGWAMINNCLNHLSNDPIYTDNMLCDPQRLSKKIKSLLLEAGLTVEYLSAAERVMEIKPDIDYTGKPVRDVTAYILRRDWASRGRNLCGYTSVELDYCLGHEVKLSKKVREDLRNSEGQHKLALKQERFILNAKHTQHPYFNPISVQHSTDYELKPFNAIRIRNVANEPVDVKLDLEAVLNADQITILSPCDSLCHSKDRIIPVERRTWKEPLIGNFSYKEDSTTYE